MNVRQCRTLTHRTAAVGVVQMLCRCCPDGGALVDHSAAHPGAVQPCAAQMLSAFALTACACGTSAQLLLHFLLLLCIKGGTTKGVTASHQITGDATFPPLPCRPDPHDTRSAAGCGR